MCFSLIVILLSKCSTSRYILALYMHYYYKLHYTMVSLAMDIIMNMPLLVMHMVVGIDQVYLH